jgi:hypothetical protein
MSLRAASGGIKRMVGRLYEREKCYTLGRDPTLGQFPKADFSGLGQYRKASQPENECLRFSPIRKEHLAVLIKSLPSNFASVR